MIIPFITQKKLISVPSQEEARRITDILKENKIEYYEKTQRTGGNAIFSAVTDFRASAKSTMYGGYTDSGLGGYVYIIYVKRKDYERTLELIRY